jgi:hypothetical protein
MPKQNAPAPRRPVLVIDRRPENERRQGRLSFIGGSKGDTWNDTLVDQACRSLWHAHSDPDTYDKQLDGVLAALEGIAPRNEMEAMAAAQMIAAHNAAMECHRRAMLSEQTFEGRAENLSQANKLSRTYATLWEALNKARGKGKQKVMVKHVHVHAGGQAVVGVVNPGGGGNVGTAEQSHAKQIAHAPERPLWSTSPDPERCAVPAGGDGERPLPNARRD